MCDIKKNNTKNYLKPFDKPSIKQTHHKESLKTMQAKVKNPEIKF